MKEIVGSDFEQEVLQGGKVVLDFYSSECPPCEALAPKFESLAKLYGNEIKFLKIFRQQNRELADQKTEHHDKKQDNFSFAVGITHKPPVKTKKRVVDTCQ